MTASGSADRRAIVGLALVALLVGAAASLLLRTRPPYLPTEDPRASDGPGSSGSSASFLASGLVLDEGGGPIRGAIVRALDERDDGVVTEVANAAASITDEDGRFTLAGDVPRGRLSLSVDVAGFYVPELPPTPLGGTGVTLRMSTAGSLVGSISDAVGCADYATTVTLTGTPARNGGFGDSGATSRMHTMPIDNRFEFRGLRPGLGTVTIDIGSGGRRFVRTFEHVRIVAGEVTEDPRLQSVDLGPFGEPQAVPVRVLDTDGRRLSQAQALFRRRGTDDGWTPASWVDFGGNLVLHVRDANVRDLVVLAVCPGYASREVDGIAAGEEITLRALPAPSRVRVRLAASVAMPAAPYHLACRLRRVSEADPGGASFAGDPRSRDERVRFAADREVIYQDCEPGTYRVELLVGRRELDLERKDEIEGWASAPLGSSDGTVVVAEAGSQGECVIDTAADLLNAVYAGMR